MVATPVPASGQAGRTDSPRPDAARPLRAEFIAVTSDDALLEQIGQALDGESLIRPVETVVEAREFLRPSQPCVLLLDARGLGELGTIVQDLQSPGTSSVVVVFAPAGQTAEVAGAIRGSAAFAVLPIPLEQVQATAVIEGAREESLARHTLIAAEAAKAAAMSAAPPPAPVEPETPVAVVHPMPAKPAESEPVTRKSFVEVVASGGAHGGRSRIVAASVAGLVLLAATVAWIVLREPPAVQDAPPPSGSTAPLPKAEIPPPAPAPEALQAGSVDDLLYSARAAMRERRYTDPEGDNALNYYRSVLAQEPDNGEAREGLQRIAAVLHERGKSAISERRIDEATRTLAQLRAIRPDDPALPQLEAGLADARIRAALDAGDVERAGVVLRQAARASVLPAADAARWRSEIDRRQSGERAEQLSRLVSTRIRQGKLVDPATDSAKHYLEQLRQVPRLPQDLNTRATRELQQAYLKKVRDTVAKGQQAEAERWKTEARAIGVSAAELTGAQREAASRPVVAETKQEGPRLARLVQERIADGQLLEPPGDSAVFHLNALRTLDPSSEAVASSERALSAKLLARGRSALAGGKLDEARASATAARQLGVSPDAVAVLERDIAAATGSGGATEPKDPVRLKRTRYVTPVYPKEALEQGLRGEVRVRVTVDAEGKVSDAVVLESNPPNVFDAAAVAAARKWRFKRIAEKDSGADVVAVGKIVFEPEDAKQ